MKNKIILIFLCLIFFTGTAVFAAGEYDGLAAVKVSAGYYNTFLLTADGVLLAAGKNTNAQLADTDSDTIKQFTYIMDGVADVSGGGEHTLILKTDKTLWAVGLNNYGQLGDGTNENKREPVKVMDDVIAFSAGNAHSMAITADGKLYSWGYNGGGVLYNGDTKSSNKPGVIMEGVKAVSAGRVFNTVIDAEDNYKILIQDNDLNKLTIDNAEAAANGEGHFLILDNNNDLYSFGSNEYGQLGNGDNETVMTPVKIMNGVKKIACGWYHSMALKTNGELWVWGYNGYGQLGDGTGENSSVPIHLMDGVADISAQFFQSAAIMENGDVYTWGRNNFGQLGGGDGAETPIPMLSYPTAPSDWAVAELDNARALSLLPGSIDGIYRRDITREEFTDAAVLLYEKLSGKKLETGANPFSDTKRDSVLKAYNAGIVYGVSADRFDPSALITRQEIMVMFYRIMKLVNPDIDTTVAEPAVFADNDLIADWAYEAVQYEYFRGVVAGVGENMIDPLGNTTREEAAALTVRSYNIAWN